MTPEQRVRQILSCTFQGILDGTITNEERAAVATLLFPSEEFFRSIVEAANSAAIQLSPDISVSLDGSVFEFELRDTTETKGGRRLAAAPQKNRDAWISSGVVADSGFVVKMSLRCRDTLEVAIYVKPSQCLASTLSLVFLTDRSLNPESIHIDPQKFVPVNLSALSNDKHLRIATILTENQTPPLVYHDSFKVTAAALLCKRAQLLLVPDSPTTPNDQDGGGTPDIPSGDAEAHRSATRLPRNLGISENGDGASGFLMTESQRSAAINTVIQQPGIASELGKDKDEVMDATVRVFHALSAGTLCPLVSQHGPAIEQYFLRMIENAKADGKRKFASKTTTGTTETNFDDVDLASQIPANGVFSKRSKLGAIIEAFMRKFNLKDFCEMLDTVQEVIHEIVEQDWHKEFLRLILEEGMTPKAAAEELGQNDSTARAFISRLLNKLHPDHEAA